MTEGRKKEGMKEVRNKQHGNAIGKNIKHLKPS